MSASLSMELDIKGHARDNNSVCLPWILNTPATRIAMDPIRDSPTTSNQDQDANI